MIVSADLLDAPERARLSVEDFILLAESGALDSFAKSELIDGDIYVMNAQFTPHARAKSLLAFALQLRLRELGSDLVALVEVAVRAADDSMPEPDIVLTRWRGAGAVPSETVGLIVEVSETTRHIDLGRKAAIYAAAAVPEYWVIDLPKRLICVHVHPSADGYTAIGNVQFGLALEAVTIPGLSVDTGILVD